MSLKPSLRAMHTHRIEDLAHEMRPRPAPRAMPRRRIDDFAHEVGPRPAAIACGNCGSILRDGDTTTTPSNNDNTIYKSRPSPSPRGGYVNAGGRQSRQMSYCGGEDRIGGSGRQKSDVGRGVGPVGPDPMVGLLMAEINSLRGIIHKLSAAVAAQQSHDQHLHQQCLYNHPQTNPDMNNSTNMMKGSNIAGSSSRKQVKHVQFSQVVQKHEEVPFYPRRNAMEYTSSHNP